MPLERCNCAAIRSRRPDATMHHLFKVRGFATVAQSLQRASPGAFRTTTSYARRCRASPDPQRQQPGAHQRGFSAAGLPTTATKRERSISRYSARSGRCGEEIVMVLIGRRRSRETDARPTRRAVGPGRSWACRARRAPACRAGPLSAHPCRTGRPPGRCRCAEQQLAGFLPATRWRRGDHGPMGNCCLRPSSCQL